MDEQPWNLKTILNITDDFSGYTKDVPATIDVYLTDSATKPVATATVKVIDMPFKLVFFKTDHLGTPRVITDQDGKVLSMHDYLAYGEELTDPEFTTNNMKFTGHERDPETGLDYMLARYYAAGFGRFLQVDPGYDYDFTDPMSFNLYGYVRGNPVMGTDPNGENTYVLTWSPKFNGIRMNYGHAAVATDVYDNNGNATGTVRVRDFWPNGLKGSSGPGHYNDVTMNKSDLGKFDKGVGTDNEGRGADGIVEIHTTAEQDQKVNATLDNYKSQHGTWDASSANCTDFVKTGLGALPGINVSNATETITYDFKLFDYSIRVSTPNSLFKALTTDQMNQQQQEGTTTSKIEFTRIPTPDELNTPIPTH